MSSRNSPLLFATLSGMMFFLYFTWGAWYATMGTFMTVREMSDSIGAAYSVAPIAAIITPFFIGVFADRFVNAEKLQGCLLLLSAIAICAAPRYAAPDTWQAFVGLLLAHAICFMPTLGLSNTIALRHLANPDRDYPIVRVFATAGWVVAGLVVSFVFQAEGTATQFYVAGTAAAVVGLYSFFLPKTPPPAQGQPLRLGELYGADTLPYFRRRPFTVFMLASLLASMGMMPYWSLGSPFANTVGIERTGGFFTMGQVAELFVLAFALPIFIKRYGIKWTMVVGILCWIVRFALFAAAATQAYAAALTLMTIAVLLHGFSYDFVFISGNLFVDRHVDENIRAQAQGLLVVFTQGIGFLLSSQIFVSLVFPRVVGETGGPSQWQQFWLAPAGFMAVVLVLFWGTFRESNEGTDG